MLLTIRDLLHVEVMLVGAIKMTINKHQHRWGIWVPETATFILFLSLSSASTNPQSSNEMIITT